ncbi:putative serine/threonine-protein phosphatase 7 [Paratrimastix pyriformis]|uniref:Serine/threonine-protein phosphatase n=1 Tax=Paratrimastix pyriformis TaxID=342808 RepID=A0ABQ8UJM1_9EUKA|nr:putative serine/threonine-protein phosphatase 7 [Paratrimastix pyriformis]
MPPRLKKKPIEVRDLTIPLPPTPEQCFEILNEVQKIVLVGNPTLLQQAFPRPFVSQILDKAIELLSSRPNLVTVHLAYPAPHSAFAASTPTTPAATSTSTNTTTVEPPPIENPPPPPQPCPPATAPPLSASTSPVSTHTSSPQIDPSLSSSPYAKPVRNVKKRRQIRSPLSPIRPGSAALSASASLSVEGSLASLSTSVSPDTSLPRVATPTGSPSALQHHQPGSPSLRRALYTATSPLNPPSATRSCPSATLSFTAATPPVVPPALPNTTFRARPVHAATKPQILCPPAATAGPASITKPASPVLPHTPPLGGSSLGRHFLGGASSPGHHPAASPATLLASLSTSTSTSTTSSTSVSASTSPGHPATHPGPTLGTALLSSAVLSIPDLEANLVLDLEPSPAHPPRPSPGPNTPPRTPNAPPPPPPPPPSPRPDSPTRDSEPQSPPAHPPTPPLGPTPAAIPSHPLAATCSPARTTPSASTPASAARALDPAALSTWGDEPLAASSPATAVTAARIQTPLLGSRRPSPIKTTRTPTTPLPPRPSRSASPVRTTAAKGPAGARAASLPVASFGAPDPAGSSLPALNPAAAPSSPSRSPSPSRRRKSPKPRAPRRLVHKSPLKDRAGGGASRFLQALAPSHQGTSLVVIGDLHGQFLTLHQILTEVLRLTPRMLVAPPAVPSIGPFIFLGDYVDRTLFGCEVLLVLMLFLIARPALFIPLRGNHECLSITEVYGFKEEVLSKYDESVYAHFIRLFEALPLAAHIRPALNPRLLGTSGPCPPGLGAHIPGQPGTTCAGRCAGWDQTSALCLHGGLWRTRGGREVGSLTGLRQLRRGKEEEFAGPLADLLWSDPNPTGKGMQESARGVGFLFGPDVFENFCRDNRVQLLIRAHEGPDARIDFPPRNPRSMMDGHCVDIKCLSGHTALTVFSAANYVSGAARMGNRGALLRVRLAPCGTVTSCGPTPAAGGPTAAQIALMGEEDLAAASASAPGATGLSATLPAASRPKTPDLGLSSAEAAPAFVWEPVTFVEGLPHPDMGFTDVLQQIRLEAGQQILLHPTTDFLAYRIAGTKGTKIYRFESPLSPIGMGAASTATFTYALPIDGYEATPFWLTTGTVVDFRWNFDRPLFFSIYRNRIRSQNEFLSFLGASGSGSYTVETEGLYLFEVDNAKEGIINPGFCTFSVKRPFYQIPRGAAPVGANFTEPIRSASLYLLVIPPDQAGSTKACTITYMEARNNSWYIVAIILSTMFGCTLALLWGVAFCLLPASGGPESHAASPVDKREEPSAEVPSVVIETSVSRGVDGLPLLTGLYVTAIVFIFCFINWPTNFQTTLDIEPGQQILVPITTEYLGYWLDAATGTTTYRFPSETRPSSIAMSVPSVDTYSFSLAHDYYEYYSYYLSAGTNVSFSWKFSMPVGFNVFQRVLDNSDHLVFRAMKAAGSGQYITPADDMYYFEVDNSAYDTSDGWYTLSISRPLYDVPSTAEVLTGSVRGNPSASSTIYLLVTPPAEACNPKYCKISLVEYCSNVGLIIAIVFTVLSSIGVVAFWWLAICFLPDREKSKAAAAQRVRLDAERAVREQHRAQEAQAQEARQAQAVSIDTAPTIDTPLTVATPIMGGLSVPVYDPAPAPGKLSASIEQSAPFSELRLFLADPLAVTVSSESVIVYLIAAFSLFYNYPFQANLTSNVYILPGEMQLVASDPKYMGVKISGALATQIYVFTNTTPEVLGRGNVTSDTYQEEVLPGRKYAAEGYLSSGTTVGFSYAYDHSLTFAVYLNEISSKTMVFQNTSQRGSGVITITTGGNYYFVADNSAWILSAHGSFTLSIQRPRYDLTGGQLAAGNEIYLEPKLPTGFVVYCPIGVTFTADHRAMLVFVILFVVVGLALAVVIALAAVLAIRHVRAKRRALLASPDGSPSGSPEPLSLPL